MSELFLIYCKRKTGKRSLRGRVELLGPIVFTRERADEIVAERNAQGWDASWIGLDDQATWIVT